MYWSGEEKKQEKNKKNVRKCEGGRVEIKLETAKDRTKIGWKMKEKD